MTEPTEGALPPLYQDPPDKAAEYLRLALPMMSRYKIATHPHNIAVWYDYVAGRNAPLRAEIDRILAEGTALTEELSAALYRRYLSHDGQFLEQIRRALAHVVIDIQGEIHKAGDSLAGYSETLRHFLTLLEDETGRLITGAAVAHVMVETRATAESHDHLDERLATVLSEVETLRCELEQIREESQTDALTGISNRRAFEATLRAVTEASDRQRSPFCVLMADIDHFKRFNDTHGHLVGDRVLRFVASTLKRCVKGNDKVARFGGEEFVVVLPGTFLIGGQAVAEQIRKEIAAGELKDTQTGKSYGRLTISIGVAQQRWGEPGERVVERADQALYLAKQRGRNRVAVSSD
jgi:diguanylate cyclase